MCVPFGDSYPFLECIYRANEKPTRYVGGWVPLLEDAYFDLLIHAPPTGSQQQQQRIEVVLGMIIMDSKIFVPQLAKLASS